jgi:hypothetical protein
MLSNTDRVLYGQFYENTRQTLKQEEPENFPKFEELRTQNPHEKSTIPPINWWQTNI